MSSRTEAVSGIIFDRNIPSPRAANMLRGKYSIDLGTNSLRRIRRRGNLGQELRREVSAQEILEVGCAPWKDKFYLGLSQAEKKFRQFHSEVKRYNSTGFIQSLAMDYDVDVHFINRCLTAMRADIIMSEFDSPGELLSTAPLEKYLDDFSGPRSIEILKEVDKGWDRNSIAGFYQIFYKTITAPTTLRTLPPYELELFENFYSQRSKRNAPLSPLDKIVLQTVSEDTLRNDHIIDIRDKTGLNYHGRTFKTHCNILLGSKLPSLNTDNV